MKFEDIYKLRVLYKSGQTVEFEVTEYEINATMFSWAHADANMRPLTLNYDEVVSVWRVGHRRRFRWR